MAETKAWSDAEKYDTISVFTEKSIEKLQEGWMQLVMIFTQ